MKEVTAIFDHYRVSARSVWNTAFWPDPDFRDWDFVEQYQSVERTLFDALVLAKLDKEIPADDIFRKPISFFRVAPASPSVPIMVQRPCPETRNRYWDDPVDRVSAGEVEMHFLAFFDWNQLDYRDLKYYHVRIAAFEEQPNLVGREALIDRQYVSVFLAEEST
jgi:hypothetical protein